MVGFSAQAASERSRHRLFRLIPLCLPFRALKSGHLRDVADKAGMLTLHLWKREELALWPVLVVGPTADSPESLDATSIFSLAVALESGRPEYGIQKDAEAALRNYAQVLLLPMPPFALPSGRNTNLFALLPVISIK